MERIASHDFGLKWDALKAVANKPAIAGVLRHFWKDVPDEAIGSIRTSLKDWRTSPAIGSTWFELWFNGAKEKIAFSGSLEQFVGLQYVDWLRLCSEDFRSTLAMPLPNKGLDNEIIFDPHCHVGGHELWDYEGVIDQRFMYADRRAAAQWAEVRKHSTYELYQSCKKLIKESAAALPLADIEQIVFMGAGSPDKDWEMIEATLCTGERDIDVYICDASFYMLLETKTELQKYIKNASRCNAKDRVSLYLRCFDFTNARGWKICGPSPERRSLYVIFGGTVGNIDESGFFSRLRENTRPGDAVLIAGSFYESLEDLLENAETDTNEQYGEAAKEITLNPVSHLLDLNDDDISFRAKKGLVDIEFMVADDLPRKMASKVAGTHASVFHIGGDRVSTDEYPVAHERVYLVVSRRYVRDSLARLLTDKYHFRRIDTTPNTRIKYPYAHLLFERM
jgi:hypothetical protein